MNLIKEFGKKKGNKSCCYQRFEALCFLLFDEQKKSVSQNQLIDTNQYIIYI